MTITESAVATASRHALTELVPTRVTAGSRPDWRAAAIGEYERSREATVAWRRADLAGRVRDLTGQVVPLERVIVHEERRALVWVDDVQFRLDGPELSIARTCAHCGVGQVASPPLRSRGDLGYALGIWEPRCPQCPIEDPPEW